MSYGYAPAPLTPPPFPQRSWFSRNWKWFMPTVILGPILALVLLIGGLFALGLSAIKSSEPYQHAVTAATHDARVTGPMGAPVTPGWYFLGSINVSGSAGDADLTVPLNGTVRHGTVHVVARKSEGIWSYQTLEVQIDGASARINLQLPPPPAEEK
jgi:Cytochrome oxidase complex assembly protein 1